MSRFQRYGLPLLAKELRELSARPRTYLIRVIYAAILLAVTCYFLFSIQPASVSPTAANLGLGLPVMLWLGYLQRLGLHLVLPVLACGVFTLEKERNTLGLLFLTRLDPWTIVWEKFLSQVLLAVSFLIISAPLLAFAYSLGGVTVELLAAHFLSLLVAAVRIVSICLVCSAYCRTTVGALLASFALNFAVETVTFYFTMFPYFFGRRGFTPQAALGRFGSLNTLQASVPSLVISAIAIVRTREFLVSRAFARPSRWLKILFEQLDQFFTRANDNPWTRGIVLTRAEHRLPNMAPVSWRETTTRSLGKVSYLVRLLMVVELPVLIVLLLGTTSVHYYAAQRTAEMTLMALWVILALTAGVSAAGLIPHERRVQTFDVLLVTPMSGREIIWQKMAGVRRLIWMCQVPMWTCLGFYVTDAVQFRPGDVWFVVNHVSMMMIYPWLIAWIGMWHGLRSKSAVTAVLKTMLDCTLRCLIPFLVVVAVVPFSGLYDLHPQGRRWIALGLLANPATLFVMSNPDKYSDSIFQTLFLSGIPIAWVLNAGIHGTLLFYLRWRCLSRADALLGRLRSANDTHAVPSI